MSVSKRKLAAIVFTDIVGYSSLTQQDEALADQLLTEHNEIIRLIIPEFSGREVKTIGDAFHLEFPSALEATLAAIEIQSAFHNRNLTNSRDQKIEVRIGIHVGDVTSKEDDVFGDTVNIASRIEGLAAAGEIYISQDVYLQIRNKIDNQILRMGKGELKNIQSPVHVYRIILPWEKSSLHFSEKLRFHYEKKHTKRLILATMLAIAFIAALAFWQLQSGKPIHAFAQSRLAVLPCERMSNSADDEIFVSGIHGEIISRLSMIQELNVIARTSVMQFQNTSDSVTDIGRKLEAGSVLECSVRKEDQELRITATLVDTQSEIYLWSQDYDRHLKDVFEIQRDIAEHVAQALQVELFGKVQDLLKEIPTNNPDAYALYLKGKHFLAKRTVFVARALDNFMSAVDLDPEFALAHAGIAYSYVMLGFYGFTPGDLVYENALKSADEAVRLAPSHPDVRFSLGLVRFMIEHRWEEAEREFLLSIETNDEHVEARIWLAYLYSILGRTEEAQKSIGEAFSLDPASPLTIVNHAIMDSTMTLDERLGAFEESLELDPTFSVPLWMLASFYSFTGQHSKAIDAMEQLVSSPPVIPRYEISRAAVYYRAGDYDRANQIAESLLARSAEEYMSPYALGEMHCIFGNLDEAFRMIDAAFREHNASLWLISNTAQWGGCMKDPRFAEILGRLNLSNSDSASS